MKISTFLILSMLTAGFAAGAQDNTTINNDSNLKVGLTSRVRWEDAYNRDAIGGNSDFMSIRLRPSLTYTLNPQAMAVFEAQYAKAFGQGVYNDLSFSGGTPNSTGVNASSGSVKYPGDTLYVRQGYLSLNLGWNTTLLAGRQALQYDDENILGVSDWGVYGRTFDAARVRWTDGKSYVDVMDAQVKQLYVDQNNQTAGDKSFIGVYGSWNASENFKQVEGYYFYQGDNGATTAGASSLFGVWGLRTSVVFGALDGKAEFAQNFGTGGAGATSGTATAGTIVPNDTDNMLDAEVGWNFEDTRANRLALEFFTAGENWTDFYPTPHMALGQSDVLGRRNLTGLGLHYKLDLSEKWQGLAEYYYFQRTSTDGAAYATDSVTPIGVGTSSSKDLGNEIDLGFKYKMDQRVTFSVGYAHYLLGNYMKDVGTDSSDAHYGWVMMEAKYP